MIIGILTILLVVALIYIVADRIEKREDGIFNQGAEYGYGYAISEIYEKASPNSCEKVPIYVSNQTITLVALECYTSDSQG